MPPKLGGDRGLNKHRLRKDNIINKGGRSDPQPPNLGGKKQDYV